jgi:hypothetical protein
MLLSGIHNGRSGFPPRPVCKAGRMAKARGTDIGVYQNKNRSKQNRESLAE